MQSINHSICTLPRYLERSGINQTNEKQKVTVICLDSVRVTGEDWKTARCLASVGCHPVDTRDTSGRETFMVFNLLSHLLGTYPDWYYQYDVNNAIKVLMFVGSNV
jgi:hypothetical protein